MAGAAVGWVFGGEVRGCGGGGDRGLSSWGMGFGDVDGGVGGWRGWGWDWGGVVDGVGSGVGGEGGDVGGEGGDGGGVVRGRKA